MCLLKPKFHEDDSDVEHSIDGDESDDAHSSANESSSDRSDDFLDEASEEYDSDLLKDVDEVLDYKEDDEELLIPTAGCSKDDVEEDDTEKLQINDSDTEETSFQETYGTKNAIHTRRYHPPPLHLDAPAVDLTFHPKHYQLVTADMDGEICVWNIVKKTTTKIATISHHKSAIRQICFNEFGTRLYTASRDKSWASVDMNTHKSDVHVKKAHDSPLMTIYPLTENTLATGDDDGIVKFWDIRRQNSYFTFRCGEESIRSMINGENDHYLGVGVADGSLSAFDLRKQECIAQSEIYNIDITAMVLMNMDRKLYVGTSTGLMFIFKWGQFEKKQSNFTGHSAGINCMLPLSENIFLLGSEDGAIRLVNTKPHDQFKGIVGRHPRCSIESMDVSADGNRLASCDDEGTVQFWDINFLKRREFFKSAKLKDRKLHLQSSRESNPKDFFRDLMAPPTFEDDNTPVPAFNYDSE